MKDLELFKFGLFRYWKVILCLVLNGVFVLQRLKNWEARERKKSREYEKEKEREDERKAEEVRFLSNMQ